MAITFNASSFITAFPEFADETAYPDGMLTFWSDLGVNLLNETRWGDLLEHALFLFTAHSLVLATSNSNGDGIGRGGAVTGQSVGGVSESYDTTSITSKEWGEYNSTTYGRQLLLLARIRGIGGLQL